MSALRRGLKSRYAKREIGTLTRTMPARIEVLEDIGKPGAASDLRKATRSLLEWAMGKGLVTHNVLAGLRVRRLACW